MGYVSFREGIPGLNENQELVVYVGSFIIIFESLMNRISSNGIPNIKNNKTLSTEQTRKHHWLVLHVFFCKTAGRMWERQPCILLLSTMMVP